MKTDHLFESIPGAFHMTEKSVEVTKDDMERVEKSFETLAKEMNRTMMRKAI